ncbi:hypothetical protein NC652_021974 [Populus alba x Populus x berolinensis]|nr:hypothetical protein NC652_021974 [Populus alba x Populus x berolinensis]
MLPVAKQVVFSRSCLVRLTSMHGRASLQAKCTGFTVIDQSQLEVEPQRLECLRTVLPVQSLIHPADVIVEIV